MSPQANQPNKDRADDSETPSNNLWVGSLASGVTDAELMSLFSKYGAVNGVNYYSSRSFAFVYFKRVEDATAAKDALQGMLLRGNAIKIQFAKPAKPCKRLWVGEISPSVSKEELEEEFLKFGKIEDFKFLRVRNTAFVDYFRLEDASKAVKGMNGKRIGGEQIRVDFLRSQPSRREQWPDYHDKEGQVLSRGMNQDGSPWFPQDVGRNYSELLHTGSKRQLDSQPSGWCKGDGQPSNTLRIGYPPSVHIDEQMLHNAMILYGEIERIKCFPDQHYSFVEFRSVDEACLAKEKLQGRLFNNPRIMIMFSSSELTPGKDPSGFYSGVKRRRPEMLFNELPCHPAQMDASNHNRPILLDNYLGSLPPRGSPGLHMIMRPLATEGNFEPLLPGPECNDLSVLNKMQDSNPNSLMGGHNWRSSPGPGMLSLPSPGMRTSHKSVSGAWDVFDASQLRRKSKMSQIGDGLPTFSASFPSKNLDDRCSDLDQSYVFGHDGSNASGSFSNVQGKNHLCPTDARVTTGSTGQGHLAHDYVWRGIIAKGGTPVCHARCLPIGKGLDSEIPEVINCSARTGLDMLMKHYADAVGFNIVFFLPDCEEDFVSYTEFLMYLAAKNRAGVAKFDDGTTLFLVPPSDFLTKVLKVTGPERLYGVVLKFSQCVLGSTSMQPQSLQLHDIDRELMPSSQTDYSVLSQEEKVPQHNSDRVLHENLKHPLQSVGLPENKYLPAHSIPQRNPAGSVPGVTLTPELIATLASLLPANAKSSSLESAQPSFESSILRPLLNPVPALNHEHQAPELIVHSVQQADSHISPQVQLLPKVQACPSVSSASIRPAVVSSTQIQDTFGLAQQGALSSRSTANPAAASHGQFAIPFNVDQHYQSEIPQDTQKGYRVEHGTDAYGLYASSVQKSGNSVVLSDQARNVSQSHTATPRPPDQVNSLPSNQVLQHQSAINGASQGSADFEVDKNLRYQSTVQFAANLLFQIQQQHQQTGSQAGQGSSNHK